MVMHSSLLGQRLRERTGPPEAHSQDQLSMLVLYPKSEPRTSRSRPETRVLVGQRPLKTPYYLSPPHPQHHSKAPPSILGISGQASGLVLENPQPCKLMASPSTYEQGKMSSTSSQLVLHCYIRVGSYHLSYPIPNLSLLSGPLALPWLA